MPQSRPASALAAEAHPTSRQAATRILESFCPIGGDSTLAGWLWHSIAAERRDL